MNLAVGNALGIEKTPAVECNAARADANLHGGGLYANLEGQIKPQTDGTVVGDVRMYYTQFRSESTAILNKNHSDSPYIVQSHFEGLER